MSLLAHILDLPAVEKPCNVQNSEEAPRIVAMVLLLNVVLGLRMVHQCAGQLIHTPKP